MKDKIIKLIIDAFEESGLRRAKILIEVAKLISESIGDSIAVSLAEDEECENDDDEIYAWEKSKKENLSQLELENDEIFEAVRMMNYDTSKINRVEWTEKHFFVHFGNGLVLSFNNTFDFIKRFYESVGEG